MAPMSKLLFDIPDDKACIVFNATYRLAQNLRIMQDKNICGISRKNVTSQIYDRYANDMSIIHESDTILVDRGFRDVLNFLTEKKNLEAYCPGLGQLNTAEVNASRCIM
ncbi:hypothetical protein EAI_15305 [Harpegnathos saltator]|uniref:Uncharacterized protein n=1 Tax=Harpegnathos saltator TaxID=610380 RepID=E2C309_HARSA|nr:hypothetical protein EAI_15305 [Harpegnathos saltator]